MAAAAVVTLQAGFADDCDASLARVDGQVRAARADDRSVSDLQVRDLEQGLRVVQVDVGRAGAAEGDGSFDVFHLLVGELGVFIPLTCVPSWSFAHGVAALMKSQTIGARAEAR